MKQKLYFFLFLLLGLKMFSQTNTFVASTCIGTTTGPQARFYTPVVADFDGDNDKDIIVCDESGLYFLYTNNGSNTFTSTNILSGLSPWTKIESKDIDNDGDVDVVSVTGKIFINNGSAVFTQLPGTFYTATGAISNFKIADFNGDGKQDVLWLNGTQNSATNKNQLWINSGTTGNANFTLASEFDNLGIYVNNGAAVGDIDNDGDLDLTITGTGGWAGKVYKNNGSGVFTSSQSFTTYTGYGFLVDWDKDGDLDFLAYDYYNNWGLRLWKNDGTGLLGTVNTSTLITMPSPGFVSGIVDLNGDSWLDVVANSGNGTRYYLNSGCQLTLASQVLTNSHGGVAISDFNNDNKPDFFNAARDTQSCININDLNVQPYVAITTPVVSSPQNYVVGQNAPLTASGNNLLWYTASTGGTGFGTAPTPNTTTVGTTSYWVSNTNTNGCESQRVEVVVNVSAPATHLNLDGTNDFVNVPNSSSLAFGTGNLTLEAMVKMSAAQGGYSGIITKATSTGFVGIQFVVVNNKIALEFGNGTMIGTGAGLIGTTNLNDNIWHHVACVVDRANNNIKLYVDGIVEANVTNALIGTANITTTTPLFIGKERNSNEFLESNIDEVRIWNVVRTPNQINGSKNCELQGNETGLLAYYKFDQGADAVNNAGITSLTDATANANNGTLTNFALNGSISNWLAGSPVTTGSIIPSSPSVTTPIAYNQGATASALTATTGTNGTGLLWYTTATGGTGSTTAPTPSTATAGTTSYWVASTNANGCESTRIEIQVVVTASATHLNFDGTNDFVISANQVTTNTENQTFQAWFKIPSIPSDGDRILQRGSDGTGGWSASLGVSSTGKLNGAISAGTEDYLTGTTTLIPNTWYLATLVFENNNSIRLYLNGNLEATVTIGNRTLRNSDNKLRIGSGNIASEYFNGEIDEVRVWNSALTLTDITNTMNCELQASQTNLKIYYKLNQGFDNSNNSSVTTATDSSGNTNNGTLTNFALTGASSNWMAGSTITNGNTCATLEAVNFDSVSSIDIYPNPTTSSFNVSIQETATIEIYDMIGKKVLESTIHPSSNQIDVSHLNSGVYIVNVIIDTTPTTFKLIKK